MQYSKFIPEIVYNNICDLLKNFNKDKKFIGTNHLMYIQTPEMSGFIDKIFGFRIRYENNNYKTMILKFRDEDEIVSNNIEEFAKKYTDELLKVKPCAICFKLLNCNNKICYNCELKEPTDLSTFSENCCICQYVIKQYAKIMKCCGKLLHTKCYKIYKHKRLRELENEYCEEHCEEEILCPYCRNCIH